jgi:hypothetical protein
LFCSTCKRFIISNTWNLKLIHWMGWSAGSTIDLYLGGTWFESRLGQQLFWLTCLWFFSIPPGKCQGSTSVRTQPLHSKPFQFIYHPTIWCLIIFMLRKHH